MAADAVAGSLTARTSRRSRGVRQRARTSSWRRRDAARRRAQQDTADDQHHAQRTGQAMAILRKDDHGEDHRQHRLDEQDQRRRGSRQSRQGHGQHQAAGDLGRERQQQQPDERRQRGTGRSRPARRRSARPVTSVPSVASRMGPAARRRSRPLRMQQQVAGIGDGHEDAQGRAKRPGQLP